MRRITLLVLALLCLPGVTLIQDSGGGGASPPAIRGTPTFAEGATDPFSVAYPTGCVAGDFVLVAVATDGNQSVCVISDGAASEYTETLISGSGHAICGGIRLLTGSESGDISVDYQSADDVGINAICIQGAATATTPTQASDITGLLSTITHPTIAVTAAASLIVVMAGADSNAIWATQPAGYTTIQNEALGSTSSLMTASKTRSSSGTENPGTSTMTGATDWKTITYAFED